MRKLKLTDDATPLAREVHRLMTERNLSMKGVARGAGVTYDFVREILRGNSQRPNAEELAKLAAFFARTSEQLLNPGGTEQVKEDEKCIKTPEELTWVRIWRRASDIGRDRLMKAATSAMIGEEGDNP